MIYLKQSFDLAPATPATRDRFIDVVQNDLLPAAANRAARLVGAWFCHEEWFSQIVHVTELEDASALADLQAATRSDDALGKTETRLAELAPNQRSELLEPLGAVPTEALATAIEASRAEPQGTYTLAVLEVAPGQMQRFRSMLGEAAAGLPIIASWRELTGNPDRVLDLWKGDIGRTGYRPSNEKQEAFFGPLREVAPRERMMRLHPLPYSPLQ